MLLTEEAPRYMRASIAGGAGLDAGRPRRAEIAGRYLGRYLGPHLGAAHEDFSRCRASPARRTSALPSPDSSGRVMGADGRDRVGTLARSSVALEPI